MSDVAFVVGKHAIAVHRSAAGIRGGRFGVFSAQGESRQQQNTEQWKISNAQKAGSKQWLALMLVLGALPLCEYRRTQKGRQKGFPSRLY